jgi:hypothetical protein
MASRKKMSWADILAINVVKVGILIGRLYFNILI